jgi:hypothetical protein
MSSLTTYSGCPTLIIYTRISVGRVDLFRDTVRLRCMLMWKLFPHLSSLASELRL